MRIIDVEGKPEEYLKGFGQLIYTFRPTLERNVSLAKQNVQRIGSEREATRNLLSDLINHAMVADEDLARAEEKLEVAENYLQKITEELKRQEKEPLNIP